MAFRKLVGSYKDYDLSSHIIEDGYLCVDVSDGTLKIGDGTTPGGTAVSTGGGGSSSSLGDLSATGSTLTAPSNGDLTLVTAGTGDIILNDVTVADNKISTNRSNDNLQLVANGTGAVVIEGLKIQGTNISTDDSSPGVEITGNLIPSANGVYQLGSASRRWQTAYLSSETLDIGGATISSDGTGSIAIAATGATFPAGSLVADKKIMIGGKAGSSNVGRPVQTVGLYVSDGSTTYSDAQLLAKSATKDLEFNGTVEGLPTYTEAGHAFILANGATLSSTVTSITLFQF